MRRPSPALRPFVELVWYMDEPLPAGLERGVPTGTMQLVVNLGADVIRWFDGDAMQTVHATNGSGVCGAVARPVGVDVADQRHCVGAAFRPGGAAPFFHPPADALAEPIIGLDSLWGRDGATLRERLLEQPTPDDTLRTLEAALLARVVRIDARPEGALERPLDHSLNDPMVGAAVHDLSRGRAVADVVERLGTSASTFNRRFRAAVGLNPKPFARVQRLQRVLTAITAAGPAGAEASAGGRHGPGDVDWAAVAAEHGYCDQAHLIHEFRELTGVTPTTYRPRSAGEPNHVPVTR
ncbi:helix-turn-helix domain-containing protein [Phytoactinopolyspora halotolerans]|uniref:Helix-turn-helix transcriptional regulator n=1 Tax=Phytoactinopolyspora halotolerans TaxID=1981512 RepID=A0A6L9S829_9ACTN|nr:helix-turn-helix transcriptional regulator [Phytoactinopolyspora halotolerans]NEE00722.1 helix-turn-helix transcriptional regulator [Phytoactinopolyspora halotolerans]